MNNICQNCRSDFVITDDDLQFYNKIKVPTPTRCPECRFIRRLAWRNERTLYKRACDLCDVEMFAMYPVGSAFPVYCGKCWWSDQWDPMSYGMNYDPSKSFFAQFGELVQRIPRIGFYQLNCTGSPYANLMGYTKNAYLSYSATKSEEIYFSYATDDSFRVFDCAHVGWLQNSYGNVYVGRSNKVNFSFRSYDDVDSWFLFDCVNCQNCTMSHNLRNKRYCIRNQQYTKEEYFKKLKEEFDFGSYQKLATYREEFKKMVATSIHRFADLINCTNSTGDMIMNTKNARHTFQGHDIEDCRYCIRVLNVKDCYDTSFTIGNERLYEYGHGGKKNADLRFSFFAWENIHDAQYTEYCGSSSDIFGCNGVRNKQYCILNKQYTADEYKQLVEKIKIKMTDDKEYGEHFPMIISPFAYNETAAQEFFPLTKEQATARGYRWKDADARAHSVTKKPEELPDHINQVDDSILKETIQCAHNQECSEQCTQAFRIIPQELAWYREIGVPLPRMCPNCRHYDRLKMRDPLKLWHRSCMCKSGHFHGDNPCTIEFETSFAPNRPETIYCEKCYQAEVS